MHYLEVEIKFLLSDKDELRKQIIAMGIPSSGRHYENNIRYDTADQKLRKRQSILRLRRDQRVRLTFKAPPDQVPNDIFKRFTELETEVSDFGIMDAILKSLGYIPVQRYEKYRETFRWQEVELVIDTMPFGDFLEIEGPENRIVEMAAMLGLSMDQAGSATYLEMFDVIRRKKNLSFPDITFENFADLDVSGLLAPFFSKAPV